MRNVCVGAHVSYWVFYLRNKVFLFTTLAPQSDRPPKIKKIPHFRSVFSYVCALYTILYIHTFRRCTYILYNWCLVSYARRYKYMWVPKSHRDGIHDLVSFNNVDCSQLRKKLNRIS